jgi:hypothetical protein
MARAESRLTKSELPMKAERSIQTPFSKSAASPSAFVPTTRPESFHTVCECPESQKLHRTVVAKERTGTAVAELLVAGDRESGVSYDAAGEYLLSGILSFRRNRHNARHEGFSRSP